MLKVVRGNPTAEELAAALAVVQAQARLAEAPSAAGPQHLDRWADPARVELRRMPRPGAGAWRSTYWPR